MKCERLNPTRQVLTGYITLKGAFANYLLIPAHSFSTPGFCSLAGPKRRPHFGIPPGKGLACRWFNLCPSLPLEYIACDEIYSTPSNCHFNSCQTAAPLLFLHFHFPSEVPRHFRNARPPAPVLSFPLPARYVPRTVSFACALIGWLCLAGPT